jgi:predicted 3-demethylubiquinone-9 3-methyltransferase (glyoxalase superfamily)
MPRSVSTMLMFQNGDAETALRLYASTFAGAEVGRVERWPDGEPAAGQVKAATLTLRGHELRFFDSPSPHAFSFTPSISLFVECESDAELEGAFATLSERGKVLMPLGDYGFSRRFGWCNDRFGVSWQLNLA